RARALRGRRGPAGAGAAALASRASARPASSGSYPRRLRRLRAGPRRGCPRLGSARARPGRARTAARGRRNPGEGPGRRRGATPGTPTEDAAPDPAAANFLLAARPGRRRVGLAWVDLSTGRFFVADVEPASLADEVARIAPAEVIVPEGTDGDALGKRFAA